MGLFDRFKRKTQTESGADTQVEALVAKLSHADWRARLDAAHSLGSLGARALGAVPALEEATCDDNDEVCTGAADALSAIRRATQP